MPYLQLRAGFYRVRMPIPKHLQTIIGRGSRLTRALHTADREEADRLSLPVVAEFMDIIAAAEAEWQKSKLPMEWGWVADQPEPLTFFDDEIGQTPAPPRGRRHQQQFPATCPEQSAEFLACRDQRLQMHYAEVILKGARLRGTSALTRLCFDSAVTPRTRRSPGETQSHFITAPIIAARHPDSGDHQIGNEDFAGSLGSSSNAPNRRDPTA
jgi:hypothetical protein